jgi:hypothetical protein
MKTGEQEIVYIAIDEIVGQTEKEGVSTSDGRVQQTEECSRRKSAGPG